MKTTWLMGTLALLGVACEPTFGTGLGPTSTTTTTSATIGAISSDHAIKEMTTARCSREMSCDNVGADRFYEDMDTCQRDMRTATRDFLMSQPCTSGVDAAALSSCVNDIRSEACGSPKVTMERIASCQASKLCR